MSVSLNLSTFKTLYEYGYCNVYELAPLVDVSETRLPPIQRKCRDGSLMVPSSLLKEARALDRFERCGGEAVDPAPRDVDLAPVRDRAML